MNISARIENLRKATGLSLEEIRQRLDVSRGMFHYMRSGERNPSHKIVSRLEAAERAAGITPAESPIPPRAQHPPARADTSPDIARQLASLVGALAAIEARLEGLEKILKPKSHYEKKRKI